MADIITIQTSSSTDVVKIIERGPQGPAGSNGANGQGVPVGGTTGQVLRKASGSNYDTEWATGGGGSVDLSSPDPIGDVVPNTGAFTTLSATGTATLPHIHGSLAGNLYIHVKNVSGGQLTRGTPVYVVGNVGDTDRVEVAAADFDDATKMPAVGLLEQTLANNGTGDAVIVGELTSANTGSYSLNQELFVGNNGALTTTRPTSGEVQSVGTVSRVHASTGVIVVNMQGRRSPNEAFAQASHTHAAADITSGVLDFDRIQQVLEVESYGTEGTPTEVDLTTNIVGGNLHALVVLLGADSEAYSKVVLPALGAAATGKVTVRVNEFEDASDDFVQIVLDDDTAIFPATSYTEMDPDEEVTFRWNDGRWDMDIRPNPSATTAVSIFKPATSGTLALNPMTTAGDIVVGGTSGAPARLALGTASQQLRVNSGATGLEYFTPAAGGTKTLAVFTAEHNQPPATAFATLDTRNSIAVLDFDATTDESAVFVGIIPEGASLGSGLKVRLHWMASTATADNCRWGVQFEKSGSNVGVADSFDTAAEAHSAANGTSGIETVTEITITTIDSLAAGDRFRLKVFRNADDATNDTMTGDAELVAVEIRSAA
jgi:hypothetical protein